MQKRGKILAVDDDPNNIAILEELLAEDYDLETTTSGEQALEVAQTFQPDVILLDIMMPGMDGYQVCQRLREHACFKYTKIIMVSARAMAPERLEGYKAGADDYVTKPFDGDEFLVKIQVYLRLKRAEETERARHTVTVKAIDKLRTPLAIVRGVISDIRATAASKNCPKQSQQLEGANDCINEIETIISDLFDISQLYAGETELQPTTFEMQSVVSELIDSLRANTTPRQIDLSTDMPDEGLLVNADRRMIASVLRNLIDSAITSPYEGQEICIRVRDLQGGVGVEVEDIHPAIDGSEADELLNEPIQTVKYATAGSQGAGFGLTVARELVELHGGRLRTESQPAGGIVYSFEIPQSLDIHAAPQTVFSGVNAECEGDQEN